MVRILGFHSNKPMMLITYESEPTSDLECGGTLRIVRETDRILALIFRNVTQAVGVLSCWL